MDALSLDINRFSVFGVRGSGPENPIPNPDNRLESAARDFEAVFIAQMFEQMWAEVPTDGPMGGGTGERIFRSLMIQDIGRQVAAQGGMGLSQAVKRELLAMQELRVR